MLFENLYIVGISHTSLKTSRLLPRSDEGGNVVELDFAARQGKRLDGGKWCEVGSPGQQEVAVQPGAIQAEGGHIWGVVQEVADGEEAEERPRVVIALARREGEASQLEERDASRGDGALKPRVEEARVFALWEKVDGVDMVGAQ